MVAALGTLALLAVLLLFAASAVPAFFSIWAGAFGRDRELEMWQMMRRRGIAVDESSVRPADMARAIRRCTLCPSTEECRRWLETGRSEGAEDFCPNARFFASLESRPQR